MRKKNWSLLSKYPTVQRTRGHEIYIHVLLLGWFLILIPLRNGVPFSYVGLWPFVLGEKSNSFTPSWATSKSPSEYTVLPVRHALHSALVYFRPCFLFFYTIAFFLKTFFKTPLTVCSVEIYVSSFSGSSFFNQADLLSKYMFSHFLFWLLHLVILFSKELYYGVTLQKILFWMS